MLADSNWDTPIYGYLRYYCKTILNDEEPAVAGIRGRLFPESIKHDLAAWLRIRMALGLLSCRCHYPLMRCVIDELFTFFFNDPYINTPIYAKWVKSFTNWVGSYCDHGIMLQWSATDLSDIHTCLNSWSVRLWIVQIKINFLV